MSALLKTRSMESKDRSRNDLCNLNVRTYLRLNAGNAGQLELPDLLVSVNLSLYPSLDLSRPSDSSTFMDYTFWCRDLQIRQNLPTCRPAPTGIEVG